MRPVTFFIQDALLTFAMSACRDLGYLNFAIDLGCKDGLGWIVASTPDFGAAWSGRLTELGVPHTLVPQQSTVAILGHDFLLRATPTGEAAAYIAAQEQPCL